MKSYSALLRGLMFLIIGILLLVSWEKLYSHAVESHKIFWGRLGIPSGPERIGRIFVRTIVTLLALASFLAGIGDLYMSFTGRDWFLRNAEWRDLWPF